MVEIFLFLIASAKTWSIILITDYFKNKKDSFKTNANI